MPSKIFTVVPSVEYAYTELIGQNDSVVTLSAVNRMLPPCSPETLAAPRVIPSVALTGAELNLNVAGAVPLTESNNVRRFGFAATSRVGVAGASANEFDLKV